MKLLSWVGRWKLWGVIATAFLVLFGLLKIQSSRIEEAKEEMEELERQIELNQQNDEVKEFQAINKIRKDIADEKLDKALDEPDVKLNSNTTYRV